MTRARDLADSADKDIAGTLTLDGLTVDGSSAGTLNNVNFLNTNSGATQTANRLGLGITNSAGAAYTYIEANESGVDSFPHLNFYTGSSATKRLEIADNGDISFYEDTGTTPKFFWDASAESLGIGGSPASSVELDVIADAPSLQLSSTNASGRNYGFQSTNNGLFVFYDGTAGQNRMIIDASGRLLQGNNFAVISSDAGIQTRKTSGSNSLIVGSDSTGSNEQSTISAVANYNTNTYFATLAVYRNGSNAPSGYLQLVDRNRGSNFIWSDTSAVIRTSSNAGNIGGTGGTVIGTQTSDERLKTIEDSFEYGIDTVKQLVPIAYKFNSDETETRHLGFGAQTTQSIVPEAVYDSGDCIDGYDEDPDDNMVQNPRSDATKMMMDGIQLVPVLTSALQEAIAKIEALETRLTALEAE